jgi:hypothetical protein
MTSKRYIEFDSTYRNRNCYPCPAEFVTKVTCTSNDNTGLSANDYIANEYPTNSWYQVPYAGSDSTDLLNKDYIFGSGTLNDKQTDIPIIINGKSYASMWPVDWMNGASPTYFSNLDPPPASGIPLSTGPIRLGSGVASKSSVGIGAFAGEYISMGTRFQGKICSGAPGNQLNSPNNVNNSQKTNFWTSTAIRNRNILAPEKFSGGTASAPQLGPRALEQGISKNYFTGALLFRFTVNPLLDMGTYLSGKFPGGVFGRISNDVTTLTNSGGAPLLGSLGFPYYYQKLTFAVPPPALLEKGQYITGRNSSNNVIMGYIACIISQQEIIVRLGSTVPIGNGISATVNDTGSAYANATGGNPPRNVFPGVPPNLEDIHYSDGTHIAFTTTTVKLEGNTWGNPNSIGDVFPAYFWCGYVESAIIQSYDETTGLVTLDTPFSNSGSNGFNTNSDYYLLDFNSDPSGHWGTSSDLTGPYTSINSGKPRIFFPGGLDIPNYYAGREISSISREEITTERFGLQDTQVASYDNKRRVLYLKDSLVPKSPAYRGGEICSQYTLVFLANPISKPLPAGSMIAWNGNGSDAGGGTILIPTSSAGSIPLPRSFDIPGIYYVAITAPANSNCIVLEGSKDPQHAKTFPSVTSLLNMLNKTAQPSPFFGSVSVPPHSDEDVLQHWRKPNNWGELTPDPEYPLNIASLCGAQTIVARNKKAIPQSNNIVPYIPGNSISIPGNTPVTLRNNGVLTLEILDGGGGYKITDPTMPLMALIEPPSGTNPWDPPFQGMTPYPENFKDHDNKTVYTFLNICFVNVKSVDAGGKILELEVNTPGSGYSPGSIVYIIDGHGGNVSKPLTSPNNPKFTPGLGSGAIARVITSSQFLGIAGGVQLQGVPPPGSLVNMVTYGWGLDSSEKTIYNSAPLYGNFTINYSGSSNNEFYVTKSEIPRNLQGCINESSTYPEMGTRKIVGSFKSINNQALISHLLTQFSSTANYVSVQYAAPGAYLGGYFEFSGGFKRTNYSGNNNVVWLALEGSFDTGVCKGVYSFSKDEHVNGNYTFLGRQASITAYSDIGDINKIPLIPQGIPDPTNNLGQWSDARDLPMGSNPATSFLYPPGLQISLQGGLQLSNSLSGNWIQILTFNRDNEVPINYTGSTVSQNQMVCYEVELISLILPNLPLDNSIGGLIAFYPYLYVELSNKTAPSGGNKGIIYSNNPNANRALFRVAIDDTPTPVISKFIKVDGDGAVQTIKFKPNDNLYFRVYLQNGTLFQTQQKDTPSPTDPDPFVQISAEFSIKRLI